MMQNLSITYQSRSRYLDVGGVRMHYVDEGAGDPIVMLHGNPTWSFYFRGLIDGLRGDFRVVAPDHIGCGLSDKPRRYSYTLSTHVDNLGRLMDHLSLRRVTLAVHDWGGAIGFGWAAQHADRVSRWVLFNTAAFLGGRCPWRIRICRLPVFGELAVQGCNVFARGATRMACRQRLPAAVKRGYLFPYGTWGDRIATLKFVRDIPLSSVQPSYAAMQSIESVLPRFANRPMLICWGMKDFCFTEAYLDQWMRRFPDAQVNPFADAGHYVVEDAQGRILPLMRRFLLDHSGG